MTVSACVRRIARGIAIGALVLAGAAAGFPSPGAVLSAQAADLSRFDPGYIISDAIFFDGGAMTAADIQSFLNQRAPNCAPGGDGSPCLKNFSTATTTRAADARCTGQYTGTTNESAAEIIAKVSRACGINPRVLLVTLQKEQGLITGSGSSLYANRYNRAMGYGCSDTAACNLAYAGFFNQVYSAASQFRNYTNNPNSYSHRAGIANNLRFHPNAACGSSSVVIRNQATVNLYNYTPYQPNAAALAAGTGTGDACSAYGNRNFFSYFSDWFGSPTGVTPIGYIDTVTTTPATITATGWALDPDTWNAITVHMYVDNASQAFTANGSRPDVGVAIGKGDLHGYTATMPATPGNHTVCLWALNSDGFMGNTALGCRTAYVPSSPMGVVDTITTTPNSITAKGWAFDPDTNDPIAVHLYVDGASRAFTANESRPDVGATFGKGDLHGYTATMGAIPGTHTVCAIALDATGTTSNTGLGCRKVTVTNLSPFGYLDTVTTTPGSITATGWALDPDTNDPITVHLYVDGASQAFAANKSRPDVASIYGKGDLHGFAATMPARAGKHTVCAFALDTLGTAPNRGLGCRVVSVTNESPIGVIDAITTTPGSITATGWALDPDTNDPITVHLYVDGASQAFAADKSRPDVASIYGKGDLHGFTATMPATAGAHTVCAYALDPLGSGATRLGCQPVVAK